MPSVKNNDKPSNRNIASAFNTYHRIYRCSSVRDILPYNYFPSPLPFVPYEEIRRNKRWGKPFGLDRE